MRSRNLARLVGLALVAGLAGCGAPSAESDRSWLEASLPGVGDVLPAEGSASEAALPAGPLTVEAAEAFALAHNPQVRGWLDALGITRGELEAAGTLPNPEVVAGGRAGADGTTLIGSLSIPLTPLVERGERRAIADAEHHAALAETAERLLRFRLQVRLAAAALLAADEEARLAAERSAIAAAESEAAEVLFAAGNLGAYDRLSHRWNAENAKVAGVEAGLTQLLRRSDLELLLGVAPGRTGWSIIAPDAPKPAPEATASLEAEAVRANLGLAARRARLEAAAHRIGLGETARWLPGLALSVEAEQQRGDTAWGPQLTVELPLLDQATGRLQSDRAAFASELSDYRAAQREVQAAVRNAWAELRAAEAIADHHATTLLPLQRDLLTQDTLRYNAMEEGLFGLIEQRLRLSDEERALCGAQLRQRVAQAHLQHLLDGGSPAPVPLGATFPDDRRLPLHPTHGAP